jgi:hypothetical protein
LTDLAVERCNRRRVNQHAAIAVGARRVVLHDGRCGLVTQERADQVDVDDLREELARHRAILREHATRADDARAVHEKIDAAHAVACGVHRRVHFRFGSDVALHEARGGAELRCRGLTGGFLQVQHRDSTAAAGDESRDGVAEPGCAAGNDSACL